MTDFARRSTDRFAPKRTQRIICNNNEMTTMQWRGGAGKFSVQHDTKMFNDGEQ